MEIPNDDVAPHGSDDSRLASQRTSAISSTATSEESYSIRARSALSIEDKALLRGMQVQHALRSCAAVLSSRPATAEYFELSKPVRRIGTFISHNWSTPRLQKWIVLSLHYNLKAALLSAYLAAAAACGLTIFGVLPTINTDTPNKEDYAYLQGMASVPAGLATFVLVLLSFHEFDRCCQRDTVFLDKTCVHQTDEGLKRKGIRCLAGVLACSEDMMVLYSDIYLRRLWTCYEVASWLMLHKGERVVVRPVFFPSCVVAGFLIFVLLEVVFFAIGVINSYTAELQVLGFSAIILLYVLIWTATAALLVKLITLRDRMEGHASKFSLAGAECANEDDRAVVQQAIVDFMRYARCCDRSAGDQEVVIAFEKLVQRHVPQQMRHSFGRLGMTYDIYLIGALPHTLVTLDYFAGAIVEGQSLRSAMMQVIMHLVTALAGAPLLVAAMQRMLRRSCCRGIAGCVALGCLNTVLLIAELWLLSVLRYRAKDSDTWLALMLLVSAAQSIATAILFRPIPRRFGQQHM